MKLTGKVYHCALHNATFCASIKRKEAEVHLYACMEGEETVRRQSFVEMRCSIAQTLEIVGEWWTLLIVRDLFAGISHFDALQEHLGIARNILTVRLQTLTKYGLIERHRYQEGPERFEYLLTEKGRDLQTVLLAFTQWGDRWTAGEAGPPVVYQHTVCGHEAHPVMTCTHCGLPIENGDIKAV